MKILSGFLLFVSVFFIAGFTPDRPTPYKIGDKATDFKLKSVDGKMIVCLILKAQKAS